MMKDFNMDFAYYVEKAFSQDCELVKIDTGSVVYFSLESKTSGKVARLKSLDSVADTLNHDSQFQKAESHIPRAF